MVIPLQKSFIAIFLAASTTLGLLSLMSALISMDAELMDDTQTRRIADIHMPERQIETEYLTAKPEKPDEPEQPPPEIPEPEFKQPELNPDSFQMGAPRVQPNLNIKGIGGFGSDGDYLPIVKVQPTYPRSALQRGIEGYVILEFTVTTNGSVRDPIVIEANPENIFNRSALKAALKFKYKPRVIDGVAVEVPGVQNKISYAIAK